MQLHDAISLIASGFPVQHHKSVWADLGCGTGLFTHALAHLLAPESLIYAIDKIDIPLQDFPKPDSITIRQLKMDVTKGPGSLNSLDGILMANSLHYVQDKSRLIQRWQTQLKPGTSFLIVEYDTKTPNPWVPFPIRFQALKTMFEIAGYKQITKTGSLPSRYQKGGLYAALILR